MSHLYSNVYFLAFHFRLVYAIIIIIFIYFHVPDIFFVGFLQFHFSFHLLIHYSLCQLLQCVSIIIIFYIYLFLYHYFTGFHPFQLSHLTFFQPTYMYPFTLSQAIRRPMHFLHLFYLHLQFLVHLPFIIIFCFFHFIFKTIHLSHYTCRQMHTSPHPYFLTSYSPTFALLLLF